MALSGCGANGYAVTPPDLATIYNFNPVFASGNTGQNQTIYLIEHTNLYTNAARTMFRSASGSLDIKAPNFHPVPLPDRTIAPTPEWIRMAMTAKRFSKPNM
jgi:subtilase family serine protease